MRQEFLVSYDIADNRTRTKIFKELGKHGLKQVQKSVFWGFLTLAELEAIKRVLSVVASNKSDKVFVTRTNCQGNGLRYSVGYGENDFKDWEETYVI